MCRRKWRTSMPTFDDYVGALEKLFVIDDIEAWSPAIRSKTVIRTEKTLWHRWVLLLKALNGLSIHLRFIFECLCFRDLRVYLRLWADVCLITMTVSVLRLTLYCTFDDGRYALIECKLGSGEIEEGAKHLLEIKRLVSEKNKAEKQMKLREPDLLIVLTGGEMAYTREDGVKIIPIGCLRD